MNKKYIVRLTDEEREYLKDLVTKGRTTTNEIRHANILLKADADSFAWTDEQIAEAFSAIRAQLLEYGSDLSKMDWKPPLPEKTIRSFP